jgi:hypothetical protein
VPSLPKHQKDQDKADHKQRSIAQSEHSDRLITVFPSGEYAAPDLGHSHTQQGDQGTAENKMMEEKIKKFSA